MNDYSMRIVFFAVSLFAIMTTVTLLMTYFNTSKLIAEAANDRIDIAVMIEDMNELPVETEIDVSGSDVRSLIRKYAGDETVEINIISIGGDGSTYDNVNNEWLYWNEEKQVGLILESMLSIVNPVWNNKLEKINGEEKTIIELRLNI